MSRNELKKISFFVYINYLLFYLFHVRNSSSEFSPEFKSTIGTMKRVRFADTCALKNKKNSKKFKRIKEKAANDEARKAANDEARKAFEELYQKLRPDMQREFILSKQYLISDNYDMCSTKKTKLTLKVEPTTFP